MRRPLSLVTTAVTVSLIAPTGLRAQLDPGEARAAMTVADRLSVTTFASEPNVVSISNIDIDERGRVWACECVNYRGNNGKRPEGDRILILEDTTSDGVADKTTVFYQGRDIDIAMGLCVLGNKAIVSVSPQILLLEDTDGDDRADKKSILLTSDAEFQHDHSLHSFVFGPDGRFYANFGNTGHSLKDADGNILRDRSGNPIVDKGNPFWGGMVFRCDRDLTEFAVLGHNFRNNYEATVDSFGSVWQSDNDDDGNLAVRLNYILEGGNYGYLDERTGERWQKSRIGEHPFRGKRHWHQNDPGAVPNVIETGNGAPTGVTVYEGDLLPLAFQNEVLFCDAGMHVVWGLPVTVTGGGFSAKKVDLLRSPDNNFRPVDVAVAPDGSVFVSDWYDPVVGGFKQDDIGRGRIYRIAPTGHPYDPPKYDFESVSGAARALMSPNLCARYRAWMRLKHLGRGAEEDLSTLARHANPRFRARALWLLGQIPGRENHWIRRAVADSDPNIRIVGLRLADLGQHNVLSVVADLAKDPSARVRAECAVHLRHFATPTAARLWAQLASQHVGGDRWSLEALGIGARGKWNACLEAYATFKPQSESGRRDVWWRSRGQRTPALLSRMALRKEPDDLPRLLRAFDFQVDVPKDDELLQIALSDNMPAEIIAAAIERMPKAKVDDSDRLRQRVIASLEKQPLSLASIRIIRRLALRELEDPILQTVLNESSDVRVAAASLLLELHQTTRIDRALADVEQSRLVGPPLAQSLHGDAPRIVVSFLRNASRDGIARKATARAFARSDAGARRLLDLLEGQQVDGEIRKALAGPLLTHRLDDVRGRAEKIYPQQTARNARPLPRLSQLVGMKGDVERGRGVYFKQGKCSTCHRLQDQGKEVGPNLSQIGAKLARSALFEAIVYPSAAISHNYESYAIILENGQSVTGLLVSKNDEAIQLRDAEANVRTISQDSVESITRQKVSLMPNNLHEAMSSQELVDLVQFLTTLKSAPAK